MSMLLWSACDWTSLTSKEHQLSLGESFFVWSSIAQECSADICSINVAGQESFARKYILCICDVCFVRNNEYLF